jgi:hypothetical protein
MFGVSYIPLCYVTGFMFSNADNAFKYNIIVMAVYAGGLFALMGYMGNDFFNNFNLALSPFYCLIMLLKIATSTPNPEDPVPDFNPS